MLILQLFNLLVCLHLKLYLTDQIIILIWKMRIFSTSLQGSHCVCTCFSMLNVRWLSDRLSMLFTLHLGVDHQNEDLWKLASNYSVSMKWKPLPYQNKIVVHLVQLHVTHGVLLLSSLYTESLTRKICFSSSDLCREWYIDHRSRAC